VLIKTAIYATTFGRSFGKDAPDIDLDPAFYKTGRAETRSFLSRGYAGEDGERRQAHQKR
jgi:hypothetical protein